MFDAFSSTKIPPRSPGYGYPPPHSGPGYPSGPPPPGPGYSYGPPPPPYSHHTGYNNNNTYGAPYGAPAHPSNNYGYSSQNPNSYPGLNSSYYNHTPPPPQNNGPSYRPPPGQIAGPTPIPAPMNNTTTTNTTNNNTTNNNTTPKTYLLRQSPTTHKIILIHPSGTPVSSPPLYSLTSSAKNSKADYVLARGPDPNSSPALVAEVKAHTFSSKYDLVVRGKSCLLRSSTSGTSYTIEIPQMGKYKWVTDSENMSSKMWLREADDKTKTLATYDKSKGPSSVGAWKKFVGGRDRELVVNVPCSEFFVEVLLVSLYAVKMAKEGALEAAGEIVGALAGA